MRATRFSIALLLFVGAGAALAQAGRFQFVHGDVHVTHPDASQVLAAKGDTVDEGDIIDTGAAAQAQLLMSDEGVIALRPDSRLRIDAYRFSAQEDASDRGILGLLKGGFRSITGLIGRRNKDNYRVQTVTATIGIRGTDHEPFYIAPPAPGETPLGPPGTYDKVNTGRTYLESAGGSVEIGVNQVGFVAAGATTPPIHLPSVPDFLKATPALQSGARPATQTASPGSSPAASSGAVSTASDTAGPADAGGTPPPAAPGAATLLQMAIAAAPTVALLPPSSPGAFDPANPTSGGGVSAPNGTAIAGGGVSANGANTGAGSIGDPDSKLIILLDAGGALATVAGNNFSYNRNGAPLLMSGAATVGGEAVTWGIYNGGVMVDNGVTSSPLFYWMSSPSASSAASLLSAMPAPGASLTFATTGGFTSPINESGAVGGGVAASVTLKNLAGVPSVFAYTLTVDDALGRAWNATLVAPQSLASLRSGGVQNLSGVCVGCAVPAISGNLQGVVIGNPVAGMIASYKMNAGSAAVAGAVLTH